MSFKLKLVAYFLLVSLLPLGAAAWGLHSIARRSAPDDSSSSAPIHIVLPIPQAP